MYTYIHLYFIIIVVFFQIEMLPSLTNYIVIKFFIGVSPRSRDLSYMLQYICNSIWHNLSVSMSLPDLSL